MIEVKAGIYNLGKRPEPRGGLLTFYRGCSSSLSHLNVHVQIVIIACLLRQIRPGVGTVFAVRLAREARFEIG